MEQVQFLLRWRG